ncbi:MAG: hypothetical protein QOD90_1107 [Mycobacterium sp.]|jgi:hypothetical protein|nr:hypothetical protein [Mycobacterium sp.]
MPAKKRRAAAPPPPVTIPARLPVAKSLAEVIANFDTVVAWAIVEPSGIGYFATMYRRATIAIDAAIRDGKTFRHPETMARFAMIFSQRYFDALNAYLDPRRFERPTHVWQWHFVGLEYEQPIVFQHLLTAVDAHVNLDLGIAASRIGRGKMPDLRADFDMVNTILASQVQAVLSALGDVSPNIKKLRDKIPDAVEVAAINKLLQAFRDLAWKFALALSDEPEDRFQELVDLHDAWAGSLATFYLYPPGELGQCVRWIAEAESRDVAAIIARLNEGAETPQPINPAFLA